MVSSWRWERPTSTGIRYIPVWALIRFPLFHHSITSMPTLALLIAVVQDVQRIRSTQDLIRGLQRNIEDWVRRLEKKELKVFLLVPILFAMLFLALDNQVLDALFFDSNSTRVKLRSTPLFLKLKNPLSCEWKICVQIFITKALNRLS